MSGGDARARSAGERAALEGLARLGAHSILVVYDHVPRPDASGADLRLFQILEILARAGNRSTLLGRNSAPAPKDRARLETLGVEVLAPDPERVVWERLDAPRIDLPRLLRERCFDLALLYQYFWVGIGVAEQYLAPIREHSPGTRVMLLSDDCQALREKRRAEREKSRTVLERSRGLSVKELDTYRRADLVLTITPDDAQRMSDDVPGLEPAIVGFCQAEIPHGVPGFDARSGLLFIGSGANDANLQAVSWFAGEIFPHVRAALPQVELDIVGEPPAGGWECASAPGVRVIGRVDDLAAHLDGARVFVSPITYGTGLKTKNVQALGRGLPMVLTSISAEGMRLEGKLVACVHDDVQAFARAVIALCTDRARWKTCSESSLAHARTWFSRERVIRDLTAVISRADALEPKSEPAGHLGPGMIVERELPERFANGRCRNRSAAHVELARAWRSAGRFEEAKQEILNVFCELCCLPSDALVFSQLHALLSVIYLAGEEYEEAALAAREALAIQPDLDGEAREALERVKRIATEKASNAKREMERLIEEAREVFRSGDPRRAVGILLAALERDSTKAGVWSDLGVVLHAMGETGEALGAFDRALAIDSSARDARINRAHIQRMLGRIAHAAADVRALLASDPGDAESRELAALCGISQPESTRESGKESATASVHVRGP